MRKVYKDFLTDQPHRTFNLVGSDGQTIHNNIHLEDTTVYTQTGDKFGAGDMNKAVEVINNDNVTIPVSAWQNNIATLVVAEATTSSLHLILPQKLSRPAQQSELDNLEAVSKAGLADAGQETGKLYIRAKTVPTVELKVRIVSCL